MIERYKGGNIGQRLARLLAVAAAGLAAAGCAEEFGPHDAPRGDLAFRVEVPQRWSGGTAASDSASASAQAAGSPQAVCTAVTALSGDASPLYLHTTVCDLDDAPAATRGALREDRDSFYDHFSLSGICYTGDYPSSEESSPWTPAFAHHLKYTKEGAPADNRFLQWPAHGSVRFFAFAPYPDETLADALTISPPTAKGAPVITYKVPSDAEKQVDLMTATADASDASHTGVSLKFGHLLTAVQIRASEKLPAGTVSEVILSGICGEGSLRLGSSTWKLSGRTDAAYAAVLDKKLDNREDSYLTDGQPMLADGRFTFLMLPQTLGEEAELTVRFVDKLSGTERTLKGRIGAADGSRKWAAGKCVTYTVTPESIRVTPQASLRTAVYGDTDNGTLTLPCSGALHEVEVTASAEMVQEGAESRKIYPTRPEELTIEYRASGSDAWREADGRGLTLKDADDPSKGFAGTLVFDPQPVFRQLHQGFAATEQGTEAMPRSLTEETGGETANCYMIDAPGYYSLPLVYGNALKKGGDANPSAYTIDRDAYNTGVTSPDGMLYFPNHNNEEIRTPYIEDHIADGFGDAVLVWQDSPDLVRAVRLADGTDGRKRLCFHVPPESIAQGNAVVAVRDKEGTILWSWHIWVTPTANKQGWTGSERTFTVQDIDGKEYTYTFAPTNIGYSEAHGADPERTYEVRIRFRLPLSDHSETRPNRCEMTAALQQTVTQAGIAASLAGDNTYYQWGRKDPMPPGIYASDTPKLGNKNNMNDMARKPLYHDHPEYVSTRTPTSLTYGISLGYATRHPQQHAIGEQHLSTSDFRKHWHNIGQDGLPASYVTMTDTDTNAANPMYNAWNATAYTHGKGEETNNTNFQTVTKTVFDPSPAGFHLPPVGAMLAFAAPGGATKPHPLADNAPTWSEAGRYWMIRGERFHAVGVRDMNLRSNETTSAVGYMGEPLERETHSWCSFRDICYLASATCSTTQQLILAIDRRPSEPYSTYNSHGYASGEEDKAVLWIAACATSTNSYGMSARPVKD